MMGERIGEGAGKVTGQRVLPSEGGAPLLETSFQAVGSVYGVPTTEFGTYTATLRPDGSLLGTGQGVTMGKNGETSSWTGGGVGRPRPDGSVSYRGAIYVQTAAQAWAKLNGIACVFEYEVDAQGNTKSQLFEWK
ncbi:MAG: hypothetical protein QM722_18870 [Piscinibacter sp.]